MKSKAPNLRKTKQIRPLKWVNGNNKKEKFTVSTLKQPQSG